MKKINYILVIVILLLSFKPIFAQEIQSNVYCNIEQVPAANKDYLQDFEKRIENYINNHRWIGKNYEQDKIKVSIQIVFFAASENTYNAKVVFQSLRPIFDGDKKSEKTTKMIQFLDDKWEFSYQKDQAMDHEERRFDPLTSFIDFYMFIILGYDSDTYDKELAGTPIFERAQQLCQMAAGYGSSSGWKKVSGGSYGRWDLIEELLSPQYTPVRKAFFNYHFNGLDCKSTNSKEAFQTVIKAIEDIGNVKTMLNTGSIIIRTFFDLKYQEIADFFKDYEDKSIYTKLAEIDKTHYKTYDDYYKAR
jgi:hypothetical protein